MIDKKVSLGARILANLENEEQHPVETARKKAREAGKLAEFEIVEQLFSRFKDHVEKAVLEGNFPKPLRLSSQENNALGTYSWTGTAPCVGKFELCSALWEDFRRWASDEEVSVEWRYRHDGGGMESWWDLVVLKPNS